MFEQYAKYFRNALVRANYQNLNKNIPYTREYLNKFFANLLLGENNTLDNKDMQIFDSSEKTTSRDTKSKILKENKKIIKFYLIFYYIKNLLKSIC